MATTSYVNSHPNVSVNRAPGDMNERNNMARQVGAMLYPQSNVARNGSNSYNSTSGSYGAIAYQELPENNQICCGPMSPVRRTFCLILLFDMIIVLIFYIIYTRVLNFSLQDYKDEILRYTFESSLFDAVLCAACRFVPLLLAYALFRLSNPWAVAVTTFITCLYVITKVILFQWSPPTDDPTAIGHNNPISYALLVLSFLITWIEVWFLDFQVLPREYSARCRIFPRSFENSYTETSGLLDHSQYYEDQDAYASLPSSKEGSDDESSRGFHSVANSRHQSRSQSKTSSAAVSLGGEEQEYVLQAEECWEKVWTMIHDKSEWKPQKGTNLQDGKISMKTYPDMGKVYKLEAVVNCTPQHLFNELVIKVEETPKWNPTVKESKKLQIIDDNTDIQYAVAAEAAGGLVTSRDFVNLRHWKCKHDIIVASACAVQHKDAPEVTKYVRGENRPGGWIFFKVPGKPNQCHFVWLMNTDIKGWIPQWTIDQALSGTLLSFLEHLKQRVNPRPSAGVSLLHSV